MPNSTKPNCLTAEDMILLMELAGKKILLEKQPGIMRAIFAPDFRWAATTPTYSSSAFGWTKRDAVRKVFAKEMIDEKENDR